MIQRTDRKSTARHRGLLKTSQFPNRKCSHTRSCLNTPLESNHRVQLIRLIWVKPLAQGMLIRNQLTNWQGKHAPSCVIEPALNHDICIVPTLSKENCS